MPSSHADAQPLLIHFHGGDDGDWQVTSHQTIVGPAISAVNAVAISDASEHSAPAWTLAGVVSNLRYTTAEERSALLAKQSGLGRPEARCAALIPIRKKASWWALAQDERRAIYERSSHTPIGLKYLPAIARRLHHSRDLREPFDFLTWFEYAEHDESAFEALLARLRSTEEWHYVDREIDIRLTRRADR